VSPATAVALGPIGDDIVVHTHLHVREDALTLFGFATAEARDCFESLLGAHGVGPGLALAILSVHGPDDLRRVVLEGDLEALTLVPGVGRKTAARLLLELKSRLDVPEGAGFDGHGPENGAGGSSHAEVRAALAALGYQPDEVRGALRELPAEGDLPALVRSALQALGASR
jgi:Holliday junction DNA helicase RuvA